MNDDVLRAQELRAVAEAIISRLRDTLDVGIYRVVTEMGRQRDSIQEIGNQLDYIGSQLAKLVQIAESRANIVTIDLRVGGNHDDSRTRKNPQS